MTKDDRRTTRSGRKGRGAAALWPCILLVLGAGAAGASADEGPAPLPLPAGTSYYVGMPPYLPDEREDEAALHTWCETLAAEGRRRAGTRLGADFLFAVAHARALWLHEEDAAAALYAQAAAAYPAEDPTRGIVTFHHARRETMRGHMQRGAELLAATEAWLRRRAPPDLSAPDAHRWEQLYALAARDVPLLGADLNEARGRFAQAAERLEVLAAERTTGHGWTPGKLYDRAARLRHRAGDKEAARRSSDDALALEQTEADRARRSIWRLFLEHDLLKDDGALGLWRTWPGDAFERDLMGFLRGLDGHPDAGFHYLAVASGALAAGRKETALEVYALALENRDLAELARRTPTIWRGLLVAFPVALDAERFDEAERILQAVERIADEPIEGMDEYRVALSRARADKRERAEREAERRRAEAEKASRAEAGNRAGGRSPPPLGRLESGDAPPQDTDVGPGPATEDEDGLAAWIWLAAAAPALALALAAWLGVARRRRGR